MLQKKTYDIRFPLARSMIVAGPSCSGKSHYVTHVIQNAGQYFDTPPKCILWYYGEVSPHPQLSGVQYRRGLPSEEEVENMYQCIVVLDDLMWESRSSDIVGNLFTRVAHHRQCFIIHITQNIFQGGKVTRTQSLNAHYLVLFKNPRDKLQLLYLARQMYPRQEGFVLDSFKNATQRPYGFLLFDLNASTPDEIRIRTMDEDKQNYAFIPTIRDETE